MGCMEMIFLGACATKPVISGSQSGRPKLTTSIGPGRNFGTLSKRSRGRSLHRNLATGIVDTILILRAGEMRWRKAISGTARSAMAMKRLVALSQSLDPCKG